ncbi:uncharacterized protein LOC117492369 [Trematomus bernacchii]|uniref:uncharacterized protein LOC117492369 n=1 Tax=Trematomus bernacchii TaxID=40690 RepID=UPI001469D3A3|nr:uncharacterized protein LOC117492369 [Trematomus bernacchii]
MMKMFGGVTWCCVALLLALTSVSAVQKELASIDDLKQINFRQSVPKHSLLLLHWFANKIDIDNNDIIRLTFDPNSGDYGSHHYGNFEGLLDTLPRGNQHRYYTIGNLYREAPIQLPPYVLHPRRQYVGENRDRIIARVRDPNIEGRAHRRIDRVFITQHYDTNENRGTPYDPDHTYRITINLLRQIREFAVGQNQQQLMHLRNRFGSSADDFDIVNTWGELACLGLLLYIVFQEKPSSNQQNNRPENRRDPWNEINSYIPRIFPNFGDVVVNFNDDEDQEASRTTRNFISEPRINVRRSFCCIFCICCIACICLISLCIIMYFWSEGKI